MIVKKDSMNGWTNNRNAVLLMALKLFLYYYNINSKKLEVVGMWIIQVCEISEILFKFIILYD